MNKFKSILSAIGNWFKKVGIAIGRWCKSLFVSVDGEQPKLKTLYEQERTKSILSSLISIAGGMVIGLVIMIIAGIATNHAGDIWKGFLVLISGPFFTGSSFEISFGFNSASLGSMLFRTTPILLTGLSVALAFKTGLFNIGAPGQFLMGTMGSLLVAHSIPTTDGGAFWVWLLALLVGIVLGAIWGAIPGLFKALLNINEVIVCIMTNWIAASVVTWVFDANGHLKNASEGKTGYIIPTRVNGVSNPRLGMDLLFKGSWADGGIIIAIVIAIVVYIVLNKTVFGYELRATGSNRNAARYAGMKDKRNIILSMAIAGGLAACGACLYYLNGNAEFFWETSTSLPDEGFNGIPV
ncbi:MAG: ABC transporter permease, partial [Clostridia bacterium]|nr:ABC transporter permease [Clostridia bacterium]